MAARDEDTPVPPGEDAQRFPTEEDDEEEGPGDATPAERTQEHEDPATGGEEAPTG